MLPGRGTLRVLRLSRLVSTPVVVLTLVACGSNVTHGTQTYRIATASVRSDAVNLAQREGVLGGQVNPDGTACFWIGDGPDKTALSWPYGFKAHEPPLAVSDDTDMPMALVGQHVMLAGGLLPDSVSSILGCHGFTKFWGVGVVVTNG
jgi:hypothetical protein